MKLIEILSEKNICISLKNNDKTSVLKEMINMLQQNGNIEDPDKIFQAVMAREEIMTTGVGRGVAIPHCKLSNCKQFTLALGFHQQGFDYPSIDKQPTHIVFLLIGPESSPGMHIRLLSRISRLISREGVKEDLLKAKTAREAHLVLEKEEKKYFEIVS